MGIGLLPALVTSKRLRKAAQHILTLCFTPGDDKVFEVRKEELGQNGGKRFRFRAVMYPLHPCSLLESDGQLSFGLRANDRLLFFCMLVRRCSTADSM